MAEQIKKITVKRKQHTDPMNHIHIRENGEVVYLTFPLLEQFPGVIHGFSTRLGGVSAGAVGTMNLSFSREADRENVKENFRRLTEAVGGNVEQLVFSSQTHTTNVKVVTEKERGLGFAWSPEDYRDIDGLVTNVPGVMLTTFYADCVPLLVVDPVKRAIGCAHSGWRGTVGDMGKAVLDVMKREYGTESKDVFAAIGPSICQECYEVGEEVIDQFRMAYPKETWEKLFFEKKNGKYQLNLWEACRENFLRAGVPETQVSIPDLCTCCNSELLFSHRASGGKRGNLAAVLMIKEN